MKSERILSELLKEDRSEDVDLAHSFIVPRPGSRKRRPRDYALGVHVPRKRKVYGPRYSRAWTYDELMRRRDQYVFGAQWFVHRGPSHIETVEQAMPRGGKRLMVRCPGCKKLRRQLYFDHGYLCRVCLGIRYVSQYGYEARRSVTVAAEQAWQVRYMAAMARIEEKRRAILRWGAMNSALALVLGVELLVLLGVYAADDPRLVSVRKEYVPMVRKTQRQVAAARKSQKVA